MFHSKILWHFSALALFVCISLPVQGIGFERSVRVHFPNFLPEGSQFPSGTTIGDNGRPDEPLFKLTGGTSEIVTTNLFREGGSLALRLNGSLEKLHHFDTPPYHSSAPSRGITFGRPTSGLSDFAGDLIELDGVSVSLFDLLSGPNEGELIAGSDWGYGLRQLDQGGYSLNFWDVNNGHFPNLFTPSYSISSQNPGLLVGSFGVGWIPEPSSLTRLFVSVFFCGANTRIRRRLQ